MPQPQPRQQSGLNDIQVLQRHMMLKQLQELQRQQQLQGSGNARLQNYINQLPMINKQASGGQFPPLINGTPINDVSQLNIVANMNLVQHGTSQVFQGFPNGLVISQAQSEALRSMGLASQQLDESLHGTPVFSSRNNLNQYSHLLGVSHDSKNVLAKGNINPVEKPMMQSSVFANSFMNDQCNADQVYMPDKAFLARQVFLEKNLYGQFPNQGFDRRMLLGNFQQTDTLLKNATVQEYGGRQEQTGWPGLFLEKTPKISSSQGLASLDPLEKKILFNSEDNDWEASFGRGTTMGIGGFGNSLDQMDCLTGLPSIQSGSWSALMQSAVAETSSSDTGLQEEWSGLSFQNPEHSTDNQPSNFEDVRKQHPDWVGNSLQSAFSLTSKPELLFNNSSMSSTFPDFQQSNMQFTVKRGEEMLSDPSHESIHRSPKDAVERVDCDAQQKQPIERSEPVQALSPLHNNTWSGQNYEHSECVAHQPNILLHDSRSQCYNNQKGDINVAAHKDPNDLWKAGNNQVAGSMNREQIQLNNFAVIPKSSPTEFERRIDLETRLSGENCFQREKSIDSYHSNSSQHTATGHTVRENVWLHGSDNQPLVVGTQKACYQVPQGFRGCDQGYAEQFEFIHNVTKSGMDLEKGHSAEIQRNLKASEELPVRSSAEFTSAFYDRSAGFNGLNVTAQTREHIIETNSGLTYSTPFSEVPQAEIPVASATQLYGNPSALQCFGLKLSPPSLSPPNPNCLESSQISAEMGNSTVTFSSSFPHARNQFQSQSWPAASVACQTLQSTLLPDMTGQLPAFSPAISQDASHLSCSNYIQRFPILEAESFTQPSASSGLEARFSMRAPSLWTSVTDQQSLTEPPKVAPNLLPSLNTTNRSLEIASGIRHQPCLLNSQDDGHNGEKPGKERSRQQMSSEILDTVPETGSLFHKQESAAKHILEANAVKTVPFVSSSVQQCSGSAWHCDNQAPNISARDIEAFDRSLRQSSVIHQKFSLMQQMHSIKNVETDPANSVLARSLVNSEPDSVPQLNSFSSGENKVLSFSSEGRGEHLVKYSSQPVLKDIPQEMVKFGQHDSHVHSVMENVASSRTEQQSQISLQMAPSWFEYYGTLKNEQTLPMYDARASKNTAQQLSLRNPFEHFHMPCSRGLVNLASANQVNSVLPTAAIDSVANKHFSPPFLLPPAVTDQSLAVLRPKKHKTSTVELLPWHKELSQGSRKVQSIRTASLEWAQATNRLTEKVEDEAEMIEGLLPMVRPKKRLKLTTQLMQQVFQVAPAVFLSADATSNFDSMAYFAARLALADACSLANDCYKFSDTCDMSSGKSRTSGRTGDQDFSKNVEDFIHQSKRLEVEFLRLAKSTSILDMRVEDQELEKLSAINRLAKFHSRGQAGATERTSSGTAPTAMKTFPQRYVTPNPMPRTVPEGTNCLSL